MTEASKETQKVILDRVLEIYYPVQFQKDKKATIWVLINLNIEVNVMTITYAKELGFWVWKIDIAAQKIDNSLLKTIGIVITNFQVKDKLDRVRFF